MATPTSKIHTVVPVIGTDNIEETLTYYTQVLGFEFDFKYGNPVDYAGVKSGDAEIYFTREETLSKVLKLNQIHPEIFIWVDDSAALFNEQVKNGAEVIEEVADRPWGARQYVLKDNNGYYLKFAQPI
jgi:uncharacterized glyoxalase superfamily protein PhnB